MIIVGRSVGILDPNVLAVVGVVGTVAVFQSRIIIDKGRIWPRTLAQLGAILGDTQKPPS